MSTLYALPHQKEPAPRKSIELDQIAAPVSEDLVSVDRHIDEQLASDVVLIRQMGAYLVAAGGKRLRPITLLLAAKALRYRGTDHIALAAVIELIHTATLMHDDVVDHLLRRDAKARLHFRPVGLLVVVEHLLDFGLLPARQLGGLGKVGRVGGHCGVAGQRRQRGGSGKMPGVVP